MNLQTNDWQTVKAFYDFYNPKIMRGVQNEWVIDPYAWDMGAIRMTPIESWFWQDIRQANAVLYPQYPVAGCFLDFANPVAKVGIECDGHAYHLDKEKDRQRDASDVEIPESINRDDTEHGVNYFTADQLRDYGDRRAAAERNEATRKCDSRSLSLHNDGNHVAANEAHKCGSAIGGDRP